VFYEASLADSTTMTVVARGREATSQIVAVNVTTGERTILTSGPGRKFSPKWLGPRRVSYVKADGDDEGIQFTDGAIGLKGSFAVPAWSPDQRQMVFHREMDGQWPPVVPAFSRDDQFALARTGIFPSYSPDGRRLVTNSAHAAALHNSLVVMNADGTNRSVLFDDPTESAVAPVWSPRGDRIAFGLATLA
jgi:TolB protein